jgi:hypothetical protein
MGKINNFKVPFVCELTFSIKGSSLRILNNFEPVMNKPVTFSVLIVTFLAG